MKVKQAKTELTVDHNQGELTVYHPFLGSNDYQGLKQEGRMATMPEAASVVHDAFIADPENNYSKEIKQTMKDGWFYTATKSLWVPNEGVYVFPDNGQIELPEELRDRIGTLNPNELEQFLASLKEQDDLVGFAKFGSFESGRLDSSLKLATNAYMQAFGKETAEKLAEVSDKHKVKKPYLWAHEDGVSEPLVTVSGLGSGWVLDGWLIVDGDYHGGNPDGCAFGVQE